MYRTEVQNQQHQRQKKCQQHQQDTMRIYQQQCQRAWSQTQDGLMGTEQSLKTSRGKSDYSSRATE